MKKQSKIIALALSLLLLVIACVGVTVYANESEDESEKSLAIISQSVSYSDKMYLYFAVYYENVATEGLVLNVYSSDPTKNGEAELIAKVSDHEEAVIPDVANNTSYTCRAFKTPGVALKNMATKFYVQAVAKDGTESAVKCYSVVEYFNEMMFGADSEEIAAYKKLLAAGDAAQYLLNYYPNNNTNDVATNYAYVKVTDGIVKDGYKKGTYLKGEVLYLTYNGTEDIKTWNLIGVDGTTVETIAVGESFTVTENVICVPSTEGLPIRGSGVYADNENTLNYSNITATALGETGKLLANDGATLDGEDVYATVVEVDGDAALKLDNDDRDLQGFINIKTDKVGSKYVFETDMMIESGSSIRSAREILQIFGSDRDNATESFGKSGIPGIRLKATPVDGVVTYSITNGTEVIKTLEAGEWFNLRYEFEDWSKTGSAIRVYLNGELVVDTVTQKTTEAFRYMRLWMPLDSAAVIYLDNTYFSTVTAE